MTATIPSHSHLGSTGHVHLRVGAAVVLLPLVTVLAGCGSSNNSTAAPQARSQATSQAPNSGAQGGARIFPGASGLIAAASPGILQVQSTTAQHTVVYTASTRFTQVTPGHVAAGDCVTVTGTPATGSTQGLTASSVRIVAKVNGACPTSATNGGIPGGGFFPRPSGAPTGRIAQRRDFASASGSVSSVSAPTIVLKGVLRTGQGVAGSSTGAAPTTITITLSASATTTQTLAATSAAAVVGSCATAIGTANDVGAIDAKSITISTPGPNGCRTVGRFGSLANGAGAGSGSGSNA